MSSYGSSTPLPEYRFWFRGHLRRSIQTFLEQFFGDISNVPSEEVQSPLNLPDIPPKIADLKNLEPEPEEHAEDDADYHHAYYSDNGGDTDEDHDDEDLPQTSLILSEGQRRELEQQLPGRCVGHSWCLGRC